MQIKKMKITIVTRLHRGVSDENAGIALEAWEMHESGPLDLLVAVETLIKERKSNVLSWGNIGCGHSWIEIDGMAIGDTYLSRELTAIEARKILTNPAEFAGVRP